MESVGTELLVFELLDVSRAVLLVTNAFQHRVCVVHRHCLCATELRQEWPTCIAPTSETKPHLLTHMWGMYGF